MLGGPAIAMSNFVGQWYTIRLDRVGGGFGVVYELETRQPEWHDTAPWYDDEL